MTSTGFAITNATKAAKNYDSHFAAEANSHESKPRRMVIPANAVNNEVNLPCD